MLKEQCNRPLYDVIRKQHKAKTAAKIFMETLSQSRMV
jgi:hypothetical protein